MTIKWMLCTTCKNMVYPNDTQVCLSCQRGFMGIPQEDDCTNYTIELLKKREREAYDAIQEREATSLSLCEQPSDCEGICSAYTEERKAAHEGKKKAKKEEIVGMNVAKKFIPEIRGGGR